MDVWRTINDSPVCLGDDEISAMDVYRKFGLTPITFRERSFTIPNASCPICGKPVFFYANNYGSRVFFDELGPPWPKHPCTDLKAEDDIPKGARRGKRVKEEYSWEGEGWKPFRMKNVKRIDEKSIEMEGHCIDSNENEGFIAEDAKGANWGSINCSGAVMMIRAKGGEKHELSVLGDGGDVISIDLLSKKT